VIDFPIAGRNLNHAWNHFDRRPSSASTGRVAGLALQRQLGLLPFGNIGSGVGHCPGLGIAGPDLILSFPIRKHSAMAKKKLLDDIKVQPDRFYRLPADVMRDRRFDDSERLEILKSWASQADEARAVQIGEVIAHVERRLAISNHAAE
jgi:hypothetical protein